MATSSGSEPNLFIAACLRFSMEPERISNFFCFAESAEFVRTAATISKEIPISKINTPINVKKPTSAAKPGIINIKLPPPADPPNIHNAVLS